MYIQVLKSKIHRVRVTQANLNYVGSITIDRTLMEAVGIIFSLSLPTEEVARLMTSLTTGRVHRGLASLAKQAHTYTRVLLTN